MLLPANQQILRSTGSVVWLQGSPAALLERIQADQTTAERRPRLSQHGDYDEVVEVLAAREPIYRQLADLIVDTDQRSPDELVEEIADWLKSRS